MIFLDESGNRWKYIKLSTTGMVMAGSLPVAALLLGSFVYQPSWGLVPLIKQASVAVLTATAKPQTVTQESTPAVTQSKLGAKKPAASNPAPQPSLQSQSPSTAASPQPTTAPTATASPTAVVNPTQPQSASTTGDPAQNDYGQSHKPVK